ncbi:hypothetical protein U9M48_032681 [Paspalum notatum var. saurae]|uniref:Uncharacterized protein n=1 Tax=Paspalum notatum var. saurae TaxID=547442 RepID=A0AAQ3X4S7_PASNO
MLMEDDGCDKLLPQYSCHHELLEEQKAFPQILSSPSFNANNNTTNKKSTEGRGDRGHEQQINGGDGRAARDAYTCIRDMEKLHIAMAYEAQKKIGKGDSKSAMYVVDLQTLLISQLLGIGNQHWELLMALRPFMEIEFLKAYKLYVAACGLAGNFELNGLRRQATGLAIRPRKCACEFLVPQVCLEVGGSLHRKLNIDTGEVLFVNEIFNLFNTSMYEGTIYFDDPSPRGTVLSKIRKMRLDACMAPPLDVFTRFWDVFYYSAMLDMQDALPWESYQQLVLDHIQGHCRLNDIACKGRGWMNCSDIYKQWHLRNQAGWPEAAAIGLQDCQLGEGYGEEAPVSQGFCDQRGSPLLQGWNAGMSHPYRLYPGCRQRLLSPSTLPNPLHIH